jgi:hypothetical protein
LNESTEAKMPDHKFDQTDRGGDARILSLFRNWADAVRSYGAAEDEAAADRLNGSVDEARRKIADVPATGAVGLAVKAYLLIHLNADIWREDIAALPVWFPWYADYPDGYLAKSMLRDIVRIVPELGPLAANFIESPRSERQ